MSTPKILWEFDCIFQGEYEMIMKFSQRFYEVLREKSQTRGWQSAFAKKAGISQSSLSKIISGETKAPELESVSAIVDALGDELFNSSPVIQRPAPYAPVEVVKGEDLPEIPVIGSTGAGNDVVLFNASPSYWISILPQYMRPGLVGLIVEGDSMEPTVHKGAIVGIVPYDGSINEGGIYLVHRPPFGRTIKRIKMDEEGHLVMHSDNASYAPAIIPDEGYEKILMGRVVWVRQTL